jgi:hypothetical protein
VDWQQIVSLGIVAISAFLLVQKEVRKRNRTGSPGCGHDCGCEASSPGDEEIFTITKSQRFQQ